MAPASASPSRSGPCRAAGWQESLLKEPPGLTIGKVRLDDGSTVLGVLGEPALVKGQREITQYGGWRAYVEAEEVQP